MRSSLALGLSYLAAACSAAVLPVTKVDNALRSHPRRQVGSIIERSPFPPPVIGKNNSADARNCWGDYDIDTDFDKSWPTTGRTVHYDMEVSNITLAPDGFERMVLAINGQYPGPTIEANWGDWIEVTLKNNLENNGTGIHWHGIRQYHTNSQDGVPGITECPLAPGDTRTYKFQATQYGSTWYHSHFSSQYGDGIVGQMIIHGPSTANYDIELGALPLTDWYYQPVMFHARAMHQGAKPPVADNALINGTMVSQHGGKYAKTALKKGKKHRLRLMNTSVDNHFMVSLDGHKMTIISADFVPLEPKTVEWLFLGVGQRYDVIIEADQKPDSYWFRVEVQDEAGCGECATNGNITSIFSYEGFEDKIPTTKKTNYTQQCTDMQGLRPHHPTSVPVGDMADPPMLNVDINKVNNTDGTTSVFWRVNEESLSVEWELPTIKYVEAGNTSYPKESNLIEIPHQEEGWVYWVIQETGTVRVPHPIHLHGHDFFILGAGTGNYTAADVSKLDFETPCRRDVGMLPKAGWLALAFKTDNPGAWLMHCHIAWHADEGLAVQFLEGKEHMMEIEPLTAAFDDTCSNWDEYYPAKSKYLKGDSGI